MTVRLDDIDYFLAVVRHGQVRRAAAELGISQPAVSKGVQRLERELGFPLFQRGSRGMALTAAARHFHERTHALRATLGDAIKEAADMHLGAMGVLRVGVSPLYVRPLFLPACLQLHRQRPAARLKVNINLNDVLLPALRRGDIDLSINALPEEPPPDLDAVALMSDDLCMVVRPGHPLLARSRLRLKDLAHAQWMLPGPDVAARLQIEAVLAAAGLPAPQVAIEVSNTTAPLADLLLHSDLVAIQSESVLDSHPAGQFSVLPFAEARLKRQIGVLTRQGATLPPLAQRFMELLVEGARKPQRRVPANGASRD
ncbi:MAG TPA: LysR family transcriptional regulator [Rhizobacter sp.]|nr:LysR family transcriptional regulator [Rhizobacter sp.]